MIAVKGLGLQKKMSVLVREKKEGANSMKNYR